jgi:hypothetical protein
MWLTGWMLSFIPDSFFLWVSYALIGIGVGLYVLSKIVKWLPIISQYKFPAEILGVLILTVGAYVFGSYGTEMVWRERVRELESKVAIAEQKSKETNTIIKEKIITKVKEIKVFQDRIKEVIVEKEKIIDAQCKVPQEALDILNESAAGVPEGEKK